VLLLSLLELLCSISDADFSAAPDPWKDVGVIFEHLHQLHESFGLDIGFAAVHWADRFLKESPDVSMETLACLLHGFSRRGGEVPSRKIRDIIQAGMARKGGSHEAFALSVADSQRGQLGRSEKPDTAVLQSLLREPLPGYVLAAVGLAAVKVDHLSDGDWQMIQRANESMFKQHSTTVTPQDQWSDKVDLACADLLRIAVIRGDVHAVGTLLHSVYGWKDHDWLKLSTAAACLDVRPSHPRTVSAIDMPCCSAALHHAAPSRVSLDRQQQRW
jgi:hypothetical protein